jgi:hypothetical protein
MKRAPEKYILFARPDELALNHPASIFRRGLRSEGLSFIHNFFAFVACPEKKIIKMPRVEELLMIVPILRKALKRSGPWRRGQSL